MASTRIRQNSNNNSICSGKLIKTCNNCYVSTWYHNLPLNVLLNIFQYLNETELRTNISLVCKRWRYASTRPQLWKRLEIRGKEACTKVICRKIRDFNNINSLYLKNIRDPILVIRQVCRWIPNIQHLAVRECTEITESVLRNLIYCCKGLQTLDLGGTAFNANRFYDEISGLNNLKSVNLGGNTFLSVGNLLSVALNCHKLEELKISTFQPMKPLKQLGDEDASFIISNLSQSLKALTLDASTLTNFSFTTIMSCGRLEKLALHRAGNLSSDILIHLWKYLPNIRVLKIRHAHQITGENVAELFHSGKHIMRQISVVDFTGCWKISDVGIAAIASCCRNLKSLTLKSCKNVRNLREINEKCDELEKLNVAFCANLHLYSLLPLSKAIRTLILDKSQDASQIIRNAKNLHIQICLSEYNKEIEN